MAEFKFLEWSVSKRLKEPLLEFLVDGLKAAGCTVLYTSPASKAPFLITFETPLGERQGVLAYTFFANSRLTKNRPSDEHRFQVKYGSDTRASLTVEQDPSRLFTTIFVGIDTERKVMVGADPCLHDQTPMFISIEFKRADVDRIVQKGWHAWERASFRKADEPVEVLVGVRQDKIFDFIQFERLARGLDSGHRQLLAEKLFARSTASSAVRHALVDELQLPPTALLDLIQGARRLKMAVRGWVAEHHLEHMLASVPGVEECRRLDEEGAADISLRYRGSAPILVECKNVLRQKSAAGMPRIDFQRTRASKSDRCSRYYRPQDFSVLAACLHAVTEKWEYRFVLTSDLQAHKHCVGRIDNNVRVGADWASDPGDVFRRATVL